MERKHINPTVSTIIAAYNRDEFLRDTVKSVLDQTMQSIEVIIINDASTDKTENVARSLEAEDKRIKIINMPQNVGPSAARNMGIDHSAGAYIAIVDADDICMPDRFERQVRFMQETGIDLCGSWFEEFGRGISRVTRWEHVEQGLRAAMLFQNTICHPTMMARREVFEKYRYKPEIRLAEDYDLCVRIMTDFRISNVPEVLTRYRRHAAQATISQRINMEEVTRRIRIQALQALGIGATTAEQHTHNMIRAPQSIHSMDDFERIEVWLLKVLSHFDHPRARNAVASQWIRAAIRAAPLGRAMWHKYRASSLNNQYGMTRHDFDLAVLATLRLDYSSPAFEALRRFGLSA